MKLQPHTPSYGYAGDGNGFNVGGTAYALPEGSRVRIVRRGRNEMGYVDDGVRVLALTAEGELEMTEQLQANVRRKYFTGSALTGESP